MEEENWDDSEDDGNWVDSEIMADIDDVSSGAPLKDKIIDSYKCMTPNQITQKKISIEKEIEDCMNCNNSEARIILMHNRWDKDQVKNNYINNEQKQNLRQKYGITPSQPIPEKPINCEIECAVCMEDFASELIQFSLCGHGMCGDCWNSYLTESAKNRNVIDLRCSYGSCQYALTIPRLQNMANLNQYILQLLKNRVSKFELQSFVSARNDLVSCLANGCDNIIQVYDSLLKEVTCDCGYRFCVHCDLGTSHRPCLCKIASDWVLKNNSESENIQWILAKTKKCPKCRSPIEKNQGCNHMTCRNPSCANEFCWLCLGDWSKHGSATGGFYKCNIYEEKKKSGDLNEDEKAKENAKNELERYTFYFERYDNHQKAIKQMQASIDFAEMRMGELMKKFDWDPSSTSFLREAANTVIEARRLLAWTYPIGYYMPSNYIQRDLFHQYQKDLEIYTEKLHALADLPVEDVIKQKQQIIDYRRATQTYCDHLMKGIETEINHSAFGDMDVEMN